MLNKLKLKIMEFLGVEHLGPVFSIASGVLLNVMIVIVMMISNRLFGMSDGEIVIMVLSELVIIGATIAGLVFNINFYLDGIYYKKYGNDVRRRQW